ncbi:MAG: hypothetical protein H0V42_07420 [Nocardioidaceae bacterium]|nr:hypothetical protein [Nocardioidaceae bacterium]
MLVFGLILIVLAVAVFVAVVLAGSDDPALRFDVGFLDASISTLAVFVIGAVTMLLLVLGLIFMRAGTRRANQRRKDSKELSRLNKKLGAQEAKTDATERELDEQQRRPDDGTTTPTHPGPDPTR